MTGTPVRCYFAAVLFACWVLQGCSGTAPPARSGQSPPAIQDRAANDAARFLAGLSGAPESSFAELEASPAWIEHQRDIQKLWRPVQRTLSAIRQFQRSELQSPELTTHTVFYPFSGPDVLFLTALFPDNPTYIMVGLEPPGSLPSRRVVEQIGVGPYLAGIRGSVYSVLRLSFFRTREMDSTLRGQVADGVAAPALLLLALSGHRILSLRYVRLDELGNLVERPTDRNTAGPTGNEGIEVVIEGGAERPAQTLYYFSIDLSDNHLKKNTSIIQFLDRANKLATFLKAASYMLHRRQFALLRKQILSRSSAILQDDSGIPFRFFRQGDWELQPYGSYDKPAYELFKDFEQPDLKSAFSQPGVKRLPFSIGYGFGKAPSNLLLAVRRR